ncbi:MAG: 5-(carboxyamino)imidazole ribonucleotide synthase [Planctomycetota bacterium]
MNPLLARHAGKLIGIVGGGQLGMMLAQAGAEYGLKFRFLDPNPEACAQRYGELVVGRPDDPSAVEKFAQGVDVATYEFENFDAKAIRALGEKTKVFPGPKALRAAQDRMSEKKLLKKIGAPMGIEPPAFLQVDNPGKAAEAAEALGVPMVLKTRRWGYDGKGQRVVREAEEAESTAVDLGGSGLIAEAFVDFDRELSLVCARSGDRTFAAYPLVENLHERGILRTTVAPAIDVHPELQARAEAFAEAIMENLGYVGVMTIEFFAKGETLLTNEIAPRVHNSGHWSIEGADVSQFEQHLASILSVEIAPPELKCSTVMVNLIGSDPPDAVIPRESGVQVHRYGKANRKGRKIGHITCIANNARAAGEMARRVRAAVQPYADG